ncbi:MAG TPA: SPOR domain-containing protein [Allosphingosinicella sp.]|nr:SPOR domain-containing protein [Allosphingosinicella sp.]
MTLISTKGARFGLALLGATAMVAPGAAAATQPVPGSEQPLPNDPLSANLRILAESPHNVGAMIGAGKAALELGDAQGALAFFARAEQESPGDGWAKKWEGSALVQLEQPAAALKYFRDAVSLGVPEAAVAGDRGLAWDISGDPRRAQRDYRLALSQGGDPEVTRRLALSLAISGEREPALALLQDQLQRRDRAAFRTRALVLALTGDWQDADRDVQAEMPGPQAAAIEPYLARLPSLSLADRALAVHLGHFPGNGRAAPAAARYAQNSYARNDGSQNESGRPDYSGLPPGYRPTPQPAQGGSDDSVEDENDDSRPGFGASVAPAVPAGAAAAQPEAPRPAPAPAPVNRAPAYAPPVSQWSWSRPPLPPMPRRTPMRTASTQAARRSPPAPAKPAEAAPAVRTDPPAPHPVEIAEARTPETPPSPPPPAPPQPGFVPQPARHAERPAAHDRLADLAADLDRIETQRRARGAASSGPSDEARPSAARARVSARKAAEAREPARHWVQLAHASDPDVLPGEYARLKEKAPRLFSGRSAWAASERHTSRLLVGPFDSEREAQHFVDRLEKADLTGLAWTSDAGQRVEKLDSR